MTDQCAMPLNKKMVVDLDAPLPGDGPEDGVMIAPDEDYFFTVALEKIQELQRMAPFLLRDGAELVLQVPLDDYLSQFFGLFFCLSACLAIGRRCLPSGRSIGGNGPSAPSCPACSAPPRSRCARRR